MGSDYRLCKKSFTYSSGYSIDFLFSKPFSLKNKAVGAIAALLIPDPAISFIQSAFTAILYVGTLLLKAL